MVIIRNPPEYSKNSVWVSFMPVANRSFLTCCCTASTKKLLEAYRDLDSQKLDLSNIEQTKREIETAVDNINEAFEKFLDELFREKAWDIQSDISALHTILKQDGYLS